MRMLTAITVIFLIINSCIVDNDYTSERIKTAYKLCDSTGIEKNTFNCDEEFLITVKVFNNSGRDLKYYSGLPVISYSILRSDSVICSSTDFIDYAAVMIDGKIKNDTAFESSWIGPNSMGRKIENERVALSAGKYQIEIHHPAFFTNYKLPQTDNIHFEVID